MLMTRASEYALLSLVTLATTTDPMDTETLAHDLGISKSFLAKVLQSLARQGILKSYKGVKGGFVLIQPKEEITILSIMQAAEGKGPTVFDCSPGLGNCPHHGIGLVIVASTPPHRHDGVTDRAQRNAGNQVLILRQLGGLIGAVTPPFTAALHQDLDAVAPGEHGVSEQQVAGGEVARDRAEALVLHIKGHAHCAL